MINPQHHKKKNEKDKKPIPALMVYPQAYPNQIVSRPQPMYQMANQPYTMMQPIPQATSQPIVVTVGSPQYVPIGPPVMMAQPVATLKPVVKPVKPVKKHPRKPDKILIIKKQPKPQEDDCCNIF